MLRRFGDEIWTADGPTVSVAGFHYPTRMVVIRLTDGTLFIWSPIAVSMELRIAIDALGPVRHIVAPNTLHYLFVRDWQCAYPEAQSYALPRLRTKRADLKWDADLGDMPAAAWSEDLDQVVVRGNRITTEVVFFHRRSRTAIFADLIQNFEPGWFSGWRGVIAKLDLLTADYPTVPRKFRMTFSDRGSARAALDDILAWPIDAVLAAHASPVRREGRAVIRRAFAWLGRR